MDAMTLSSNIAATLGATARRVGGRRPALVERAAATSYPDLLRLASGVAKGVRATDLRPDDRAAIFLERGPAAAAAYYGVLATGGVAVIVNETLRPRQIEHILEHSGARLLLTSETLLERLARPLSTRCTTLLVDELGAADEWAPVRRVSDDPAQIIYTSGSTGKPKGVCVSHGNLGAGIRSVTSYLGLRPADRLASLLPFSFDYGLSQLLCSVQRGATLIVERSPLPQQIVRSLDDLGATVLAGVPPLWHRLLAVSRFVERPIPTLRVFTNTGGHLPVPEVRRLREAYPDTELYLMYGLTEAFRSTYLPPSEVDRRPGSIGKAIPGAEILVLDDDLRPCAPGQTGQLVHRGPTVALGYWDDPEASARRFRPNPVRAPGTPDAERVVFSGDLVRRDSDGFLYFLGRSDAMIKTLGFRVGPDEVATVLHESGEVLEAVVSGEPDPARGERIVAFVVLRPEGSLERLRRFAEAELPRHMQPARYEPRASLPTTSSGKHDVSAVRRSPNPS